MIKLRDLLECSKSDVTVMSGVCEEDMYISNGIDYEKYLCSTLLETKIERISACGTSIRVWLDEI